MNVGIVGLPNVGKSTLFNALLKKQVALSANYPFATIEPNIGVVEVPDPRLDILAQLIKKEFQPKYGHKEVPEKIVPAVVKFYDIAGLVKDAHKGEGLGNQFLTHIREVDVIVHLVRAFQDENVIRAGSVNPHDDAETINTELVLSDIQVMEKRVEKVQQELKKLKTPELVEKATAYQKIMDALNSNKFASTALLSEKELAHIKDLNLLTRKPMIYVFNVDEADVNKDFEFTHEFAYHMSLCAKIESEISSLAEGERAEFMSAIGIAESGLDTLIRMCYLLLGLQTFFTAGPKEVRAWTIPIGIKAPQAAGKIHTDFERGFIGADVVAFNDYVSVETWLGARQKGLLRMEGKEYVVKDGDIVEFRFGV